MDNPENWLWIWLATAVLFGVGEMLTAGSFFLLPFAIGAVASVLAAALGGGLLLQWLLFVFISGASFLALRPIARRLDANEPADGIGARRLIGESGRVIEAIPAGPNELGLIRIHREEWRAESIDGSAIPEGAAARVAEVKGTRVVVFAIEIDAPGGGEGAAQDLATESEGEPPSQTAET